MKRGAEGRRVIDRWAEGVARHGTIRGVSEAIVSVRVALAHEMEETVCVRVKSARETHPEMTDVGT